MQIRSAARCFLATSIALGLAFSATAFAAAYPRSGGQNAGGVRGAASTPQAVSSLAAPNLSVSVNYRGKATYKAKVSVTSSKGTVVASGATSKAGTFSASLDSGTYAVAASSNGHVATGTVTIQSPTQSLALTLQ